MLNDAAVVKPKFKFNPFKVFAYAAKGIIYLMSLVGLGENNIDPNRLTGDELKMELAKVKAQSNEFNKVVEKEKFQSGKNKSFRYVVKTAQGDIAKGIFDAPTVQDCRVFLSNEGYEILEIKERDKWDVDISIGSGRINVKNLSFALIQLSTYIKAGIPLIDSMRILSKQTTDAQLKRIYDKVVYQLVIGEPFSVALEKQGGAFPSLLINMVKTAEMTGDLSGTLDEMADYFTETEKAKKEMLSALIYPCVILSLVVAVVIFLVVFVVPQFVSMFSSQGAELPGITKFVISASDFFIGYWWALILGIGSIVGTFLWLYKNIVEFKKTVQTILMRLPIVNNIIIYEQVSTITRTFASLLNHGVFITDSMEILSNLTENEIYKEILSRTMIGLSKGSKLSETFKGEWAFPVVAYEMLVTGESTGQLALMMQKVADYYGNLHHNSVTVVKSLIEPVVIVVLAVCVGFLLMAIIMPMFDLYGQI